MRLIAPKPHPNIQPKGPVPLVAHGSSRIVKSPRQQPRKESHLKSLANLRAKIDNDNTSTLKNVQYNQSTPIKPKGMAIKRDSNKANSKPVETKSELRANSNTSTCKKPEQSTNVTHVKHSSWNEGNSRELIELENNADYIALSSAFDLLASQKTIALRDIIKLKELKSAALKNTDKFVENLKTGEDAHFPERQKVIKAPSVPWAKYGIYNPELEHRLATGIVDRAPGFGEVRLFGDAPGERRPSL